MAASSNDLELHEEPLEPFSAFETLRSVPIWALNVTQLAGWLSAFVVLDKTVLQGARYDKWGKLVCRLVTKTSGVEVVQHGLEELDRSSSYIFCINHVSLLDLFVVFQSIPHFHRSFQDERHFKIPVYGGCIKVFGQVPVRRGDKAFNQRAFDTATEMLHGGDSFVVFPEGHRSRDGRLGAFYPGAFRLATQAQVPVVPMALKGLRNVCPAGDWRIRPGRVDVLFGEPIQPGTKEPEEIAEEARSALNALLARGPV